MTPSALTKYLKYKLRQQRAKCLSCGHPAQAEQSVSLKHNTCPCKWGAEKVAPPFGQGLGGRRNCKDGRGHAASVAGTPPSICRQACRNAPSSPFCPAPCTCNGATQNPRACKPGGTGGKQALPHIVCVHDVGLVIFFFLHVFIFVI